MGGAGEEPQKWVGTGATTGMVWPLVSIETVPADMLSPCHCLQCSCRLSGWFSEGELPRDGAGESRETGAGGLDSSPTAVM